MCRLLTRSLQALRFRGGGLLRLQLGRGGGVLLGELGLLRIDRLLLLAIQRLALGIELGAEDRQRVVLGIRLGQEVDFTLRFIEVALVDRLLRGGRAVGEGLTQGVRGHRLPGCFCSTFM